jgi:predicted enzyme related to lactoylglutathione lyase
MTHRDHAPIGAPTWVDLYTSDAAEAKAFYSELFGWTVEEGGPEFGGYATFHLDGAPVGGCMQHQGEGEPEQWSIYLASDDVNKTAEAAVSNGGTVVVPPMQIADHGHMAMVADNGGAGIGIWQPNQMAGFTVLAEPGAPSWFELHTGQYDNAVAFYREVFRWEPFTMADTPEFRYTTLFEGDAAAAGIVDNSTWGAPTAWYVYFGTADADATAAKAVELGATVAQAPEDTPYGRLAELRDPTGATFKLHQP